jgi:hypothetical protein
MWYRERKNIKPAITLLWIVSLILAYRFGEINGKIKQRESMKCVDTDTMEQWKDNSELIESICVDVQNNQLEKIDQLSNEKVKAAEEEAQRWKNNYYYLKKQNEEQE